MIAETIGMTEGMKKYHGGSAGVTRALVLGLSCCLLAVAVSAQASGDSRWKSHFPNIELTNHDGEKRMFYDDLVEGKVVAINFIYTSCPSSCPAETAKLAQVQQILGDAVGRDVFLYSITIDPENDTVEVLNDYRKKFHAGPGWEFLTGKQEDIDSLRKKLGLFIEEIQDDDGDHNLSFVAGNERTGQWVKRSPYDNASSLAHLIGYKLTGRRRTTGVRNYANAPDLPVFTRGEYLFRTRCTSCHTMGGGDLVGPDLLGVVARRDRAWLERWLKVPDQVLAEKDPLAMELYEKYDQLAMPNLELNDIDVRDLMEFMRRDGRPLASAPGAIPGTEPTAGLQ